MKNRRAAAFILAVLTAVSSLRLSPCSPVLQVRASSITDLEQEAEDILNHQLDKAAGSDSASQDTSGNSGDSSGPEASDAASTEEDDAGDDAVNIAESDVENYQIIEINSREDFDEVVKNCHYDTWSTDKEISLNVDLDFNNEEFAPLESFGGIFQGKGHKLSGVSFTGSVDGTGVFGTIRRTGKVIDLHVEGVINPDGIQKRLGGIAGINYGTIEKCSFNGRIDADRELGGIVGRNGLYGVISECSSSGALVGTNACGGIAGYNEGTINGCTNGMEVNTTYQDTNITVDQLTSTLDSIVQSGRLLNSETLDVNGDSGGIAGFSSGVIASCINNAVIGYEHVGYNVGGIAGRSSGFLQNNTNSGIIYGRKDVGGIVGQMQPYLAVDFAEDTLNNLDDQLDELNTLVNTGLNNADNYSDNTLNHLRNINGLAGIAKNVTKSMADESADQVDEAAGKLNAATGSLQSSLNTFSDIADRLDAYVKNVTGAISSISSSFESYLDGLNLSAEDRAALEQDLEKLKEAGEQAQEDSAKLAEDLRGPEVSEGNYDTVRKDIAAINADYKAMYQAVDDMYDILSDYADNTYYTDDAGNEWKVSESPLYLGIEGVRALTDNGDGYADGSSSSVQALQNKVDELNRLMEDGTLRTEDVEGLIAEVDLLQGNIAGTLNPDRYNDDAGNVSQTEIEEELNNLGIYNAEDVSRFGNDWEQYRNQYEQVKKDRDQLQSDHDQWISWTEAGNPETTWEEYAGNVLFPDIKTIADDFAGMKEPLSAMAEVLGGAALRVTDVPDIISAVRNLRNTIENYPDINGELTGALGTLASLDLQMNGVSDSIRNNGNTLYESLNQLQSEMDALNSAVSSESDQGIDNLRSITAQFDAIMRTLEDAVDELKNPGSDSSIEDVSDENIQNVYQGRTTSCFNNGEVHADTNVGGITGMIGVEYDLDPETDIRTTGNTSLDYIFRARCILDRCTNNALIAARSSYSGGIAGQMEMGLAADSQNYGNLESEGNYAGGISGYSTGLLRDNVSRCDLSGEKYVGGIAGYGVNLHNNYAMVNITDSTQYEGAIAGKVKDIGAEDVYENYYYSTSIFGINGVSYAGIAEGVSYDELVEKSGADSSSSGSVSAAGAEGTSAGDTGSAGQGNRFARIVLTFRTDDGIVKVLQVNYGASVPAEDIPAVPEKDGFHGKWSRTDYSRIVSDETITAEYSRINTLLSSSQTRDSGLSIIEVYGNFSEGDALVLSEAEAEDGETERWRVKIPDDGLNVHEIRYLAPDESTNAVIYLVQNGTKTRLDHTSSFGKYITFRSDGSPVGEDAESSGNGDTSAQDVSSVIESIPGSEGTEVVFAVEETNEGKRMIYAAAGAGAGAAALLLIILGARRRAKRRRKKRRHS